MEQITDWVMPNNDIFLKESFMKSIYFTKILLLNKYNYKIINKMRVKLNKLEKI